ncbi:uncharacterized protein LOC102160111 isoform X2 [Sus scrofa]|uniref:uncharacterized protein LOC102160111 isoform X2 n=1 Tax=Sus scrofa TaxID=9823 RepID=UPI0003AEEA8D|nr:uncharacterized protein LOC102160111 isoform X2 [Sus scrofa]
MAGPRPSSLGRAGRSRPQAARWEPSQERCFSRSAQGHGNPRVCLVGMDSWKTRRKALPAAGSALLMDTIQCHHRGFQCLEFWWEESNFRNEGGGNSSRDSRQNLGRRPSKQHLLPRKKTSEDNEWARNSSRFPSIEEVVYPTYWFPACDGPLSEPGSPTRAVSPAFGTKKATPGVTGSHAVRTFRLPMERPFRCLQPHE